jgi:hypothetical protein
MTMPNSARPFVLNWAPPGVGACCPRPLYPLCRARSLRPSLWLLPRQTAMRSLWPIMETPTRARAQTPPTQARATGWCRPRPRRLCPPSPSPLRSGRDGWARPAASGAVWGGDRVPRSRRRRSWSRRWSWGIGGVPEGVQHFRGGLAPETSNSDLVAVSIGGFFGFFGGKGGRRRRLATVPRSSLPRLSLSFAPTALRSSHPSSPSVLHSLISQPHPLLPPCLTPPLHRFPTHFPSSHSSLVLLCSFPPT